MVGMFLFGALAGAFGCILLLIGLHLHSQKLTAIKSPSVSEFLGFRKAEPEAPRDYAQTSIPRTRRSWRHQMRELQAQNNTKQKERDALIPKEIPNVRKAR